MQKTALIILDGWGYGKKDQSDAIFTAKTPFFDELLKKFPNATLRTDGENVGLPDGQMGNSEVGHLNIGAGRIVYQDLVKINLAVRDKSLNKNQVLLDAFAYAKANQKKVHFAGLVSDGGVHSHQNHLAALCKMAQENGLTESFIHAFTDGRDTDPKSGLGFIKTLLNDIKDTGAKVATITGRYYAMDRDKRWERVALAYKALVNGEGLAQNDPIAAIENSYQNNETDEFIKPIVLVDNNQNPIAKVEEGDVFICFNFRTDRCREITMALTQQNFQDFGMKTLNLHYVTMTRYDETFKNVNVVFEKDNLTNTVGEVISNAGLSQIRMAETEKYPHVTFFFSGGREEPFKGEKRLMAASPKVATYDLQPEMSAKEVTDKITAEIENHKPDFICLNYANPDMVGHTGVFSAIVKAVEFVDYCLKKVVEKAVEHDYALIIIADHGNADFAINQDGSPNTAHTTNPVPVILVNAKESPQTINNGILADVAPTALKLLKVKQPDDMTGKPLF
jgi:2,3-bisphosphoglycerate-independent phosphoglycerate mutase